MSGIEHSVTTTRCHDSISIEASIQLIGNHMLELICSEDLSFIDETIHTNVNEVVKGL